MSVRRDPDRGTWSFVLDVPRPDGGRQQVRRRGFATKREALAAEHALREEAAVAGSSSVRER